MEVLDKPSPHMQFLEKPVILEVKDQENTQVGSILEMTDTYVIFRGKYPYNQSDVFTELIPWTSIHSIRLEKESEQ